MLLLLVVALMFAENVNNVPLVDIETVKNVTQNPETLEELFSDQNTLVEGDMLVVIDRNAVGGLWPTTDLPYEISPEISKRTDDILAAMAMVSKHTCITFHIRKSTELNYVRFKTANGCASHVGFITGQQSVFVAPSCSVGNIAHEILHTLGFEHEHTRLDRDSYIDIAKNNIIPGMEKNFKKLVGKTFDIPYDYTSIMHYGRSFFSSNGEPTIIPKKNVRNMGQRARLMNADIRRIVLLYNCDSIKSNATVDS